MPLVSGRAIQYANWLLHEGKHEDAIQVAIQVAMNGPQHAKGAGDRAKLLHLMAIGYAYSDQAKQAIFLMREAKRLNPTDQALASNLQTMKQLVTALIFVSPMLTLPPKEIQSADDVIRQVAA